jgi:cell wall-associated NlpC family hydrolase
VVPLTAQNTFSKDEKPFATISKILLGPVGRDSLVEAARSQVGAKYKLGAKAPGKAFDCSGLVQWVMALFGSDMPRTAKLQAKQGIEIPKDPSQLLPGDLLYFGRGKVVNHIGIYIGDGKFVHAAETRKGVIEANLPTGHLADTWWKGVRRVFNDAEDTTTAPPKPDSTGAKRKIVT